MSESDEPLRDAERDEIYQDQDEIDVELRSPGEVRTRVLILATVLRRLALENPAIEDGGDLSAEAFDEREWLREQGLERELTPGEAALLDSPLGSVAPEAVGEASWQGEALVLLGWAIEAVPMPPVAAVSDPRPVIDIVPRPWDKTENWLRDPAFVSESGAVRQREIAEIWYWRLTTEVLRRTASAVDRQNYEVAIHDVAREALAAGLVPDLHNGDFLVDGRGIKDLSENDVDELIAVTGQRLRALNWLCGFGSSWDDVPLDV
jgi:hypothetical protein